MKFKTLTFTTALATLTLAGPVQLAQAQQRPQHQTHYVVKDLGTLGGSESVAEGISDRGWVAGDAMLAGDQSVHATLWRNGIVTDLGTLGGINSQEQWPVKDNRGLIVGDAETAATDPFNEDFCGFDVNDGIPPTGLICVGFLWQNGVMTALPTLGGNNAQALSANNHGQAVGFAEYSTQDPNCIAPQVLDVGAVIWGPRPGEIHTLAPLPGDISAWAIGINDHEQVAGVSGNCVSGNFNGTGAPPQHGVIWQNGTVTDLGNLGGTCYTFPWAINNRGQIAGQSCIPGDQHVHTFLWQKGSIFDLGVLPGDTDSGAFGLNDRGTVVGGSCNQNGCRAYLWQNGVMTDVNTLIKPGSTSLYLWFGNDINDRGEIAAVAFDQTNGEFHATLAIPCDGAHSEVEDCMRQAGGDRAAIEQTERSPKMTIPENVREMLERRMRFGRQKSQVRTFGGQNGDGS